MEASLLGLVEIVAALLASGADRSLECALEEETALQFADRCEDLGAREEIRRLLTESP